MDKKQLEDLFALYKDECETEYNRLFDPVISYRPHETIKNAIVVEHRSGDRLIFDNDGYRGRYNPNLTEVI